MNRKDFFEVEERIEFTENGTNQSSGPSIWLLLAGVAVALALWRTPVVYPVKLFVVLLHEISHGLMAILWGGSIEAIRVSSDIGGVCEYRITPSWLAEMSVASAGYLGSMIWGALILFLSCRLKNDRYITLAIGVILLFFSYFVILSGEWFGIIFTVGFAFVLLAAAKWLPDIFHDYFLHLLGIISCLYVVADIADDLIFRSGIGSDADRIAELSFIPSVVVGVLWIVLALGILFLVLRWCFVRRRRGIEGLPGTSRAARGSKNPGLLM
jgi:hypothetical protein